MNRSAWRSCLCALSRRDVHLPTIDEEPAYFSLTGAVNQHGEVQAGGGVTRKVEGFYVLCRERGPTGEQGVMMPAANVKNLMLKEEVVEAVRAGRFHVWGVSHIDEGIELLMERVAGERAAHGTFPEGTVHRLAQDRLREYAEQVREFGAALAGAPSPANQIPG